MAAVQYHGPGEREITLAADASSGDIILAADGKACVITANQRTANGDVVRAVCEGVFEVDAITSDTYSAGALVYLTEATQVAATTAGSGKILIGPAAYAKTNGQTSVFVDLNGTRTSVDDHS